jgi:hypothetical protein
MNVLVKRLRELCAEKQEPEALNVEKWWDPNHLPPNMQPDELMRDDSHPGQGRGINACSLQATAEWAWVRPTDAGVTADALCCRCMFQHTECLAVATGPVMFIVSASLAAYRTVQLPVCLQFIGTSM